MAVHRSSLPRAALLVATIAGCVAPAPETIQTFRSQPTTWRSLHDDPIPPGSLRVERGHLDLAGEAVYYDDTVLGDFSAIADVALTGADPRGFAGVFVFEPGAPDRACACVAVRPGGEWRAYRTSQPLEPQGGRGWMPPGRASPAGFFRLGIVAAVGEVRLSVDGREVERYAGDAAPGGARVPGNWSGLRFGLFSTGASSRWKNFIAGGRNDGLAVRPEAHVYWGDKSDAEALLLEARTATKALGARVSRAGIYGAVAVLEEAYRAFLDSGDAARARSVLELAARTEASTREGARSIGDGDLHERAFERLAALSGSPLERPSAAAGDSKSLDARLASLKAKLRPLRLDFAVENGAKQPIFEPAAFWEALRESYGGLARSRDGELRVRVKLERSANESESTESERKVPAGEKGSQRLAAVDAEITAIEARLPEELLDAETRASVMRGAAGVLGSSSLLALRKLELDGKTVELHMDDAQTLEKTYKRLANLRAERKKLQGNRQLDYRSIRATLHTNSIWVETSYTVELDGRSIVNVTRERTYLGIEQWTHPANEAAGIAASSYRKDRVTDAVAHVRARALSRFRTAVSRESLLSKLEAAARLDFLVRLAKATGEEEDVLNLQWCLKSELKLEGSALERSTRSLLE